MMHLREDLRDYVADINRYPTMNFIHVNRCEDEKADWWINADQGRKADLFFLVCSLLRKSPELFCSP